MGDEILEPACSHPSDDLLDCVRIVPPPAHLQQRLRDLVPRCLPSLHHRTRVENKRHERDGEAGKSGAAARK